MYIEVSTTHPTRAGPSVRDLALPSCVYKHLRLMRAHLAPIPVFGYTHIAMRGGPVRLRYGTAHRSSRKCGAGRAVNDAPAFKWILVRRGSKCRTASHLMLDLRCSRWLGCRRRVGLDAGAALLVLQGSWRP